jgi:hypothetical protein
LDLHEHVADHDTAQLGRSAGRHRQYPHAYQRKKTRFAVLAQGQQAHL